VALVVWQVLKYRKTKAKTAVNDAPT